MRRSGQPAVQNAKAIGVKTVTPQGWRDLPLPTSVSNETFFSDVFLETRFRDSFADASNDSRRIWFELKALYDRARPERFGPGLEATLREEFIDKVLDVIGWQRSSEGSIPSVGNPDYTLFLSTTEKQSALENLKTVAFFDHASVLLEAKSWNVEVGPRSAGGSGVIRQIYRYIEGAHVRWGMATNGREWLLVSRDFSQAQGRVICVDLARMLTSPEWTPDFNYFYLLFSHRAFEDGIVDRGLRESEISGEIVGKDLKRNVFQALLLLGRAIAEARPSLTESPSGLSELKENCLTLLYRLLFVNYAESRRLVPMEESDIYRRNFSLQGVKESVRRSAPGMRAGEYASIANDTPLYTRKLRQLFRVIDQGSVPARIPPYNGGLFDPTLHPLLEEDILDNRTLAQVIDLLSRSVQDLDRFVDYSYLGVRELGSIYEGILEYNFERKPESPEPLQLVFSGGERKVTGSYYTPEPVVSYIVEKAVGPIVDEALAAAGLDLSKRIRAILATRVVDPSMGSGHFLVAAVEYLADRLLRELGSESVTPVDLDAGSELQSWAKREVASHCIYGVDVNPMAVELAKVSVWLTTFGRDRPLSFLDAHLQHGNSVIGTWIDDLPSLPSKSRRPETESSARGPRVLRFDISGLLEGLKERTRAIDILPEDTAEQVSTKRRKFAEVRQSQFFRRLWTAANLRTGIRDLTEDDQREAEKDWSSVVRAIPDADEQTWRSLLELRWARAALQLAEARSPFHWEIAFPDIFTNRGAGFDSVIGNPPYVRIYRGSIAKVDRSYFQRTFVAAHMKFDLYVVFFEQAIRIARRGGRIALIVPDKFTTSPYGEPLRRLILRDSLESILDLRGIRIFEGVSVSNLIPVVRRTASTGEPVTILRPAGDDPSLRVVSTIASVAHSLFLDSPQSQIRLDADFHHAPLLSKIQASSIPLRDAFYVNWGLRTGTKERTRRLIHSTPEGSNPKELLRGEDVREPYILVRPQRFIEYSKNELYNPMFSQFFESRKLVFRKISGKTGMMAIVDESGAYCFSTLICAVNRGDIANADWPGIPRTTPVSRRISDPYVTLAICNSALVKWWYRQTYSDNIGVNPNHVKAIPLPRSLLSGPSPRSTAMPQWSQADAVEQRRSEWTPGELEEYVGRGARELQRLGTRIAEETVGFLSWLQREFGVGTTPVRGIKKIERFEAISGPELLRALKRGSAEIGHRLQDRESQERLIREHSNAVKLLGEYRREFAKVAGLVERAIHLLFGLSQSESDAVIRG